MDFFENLGNKLSKTYNAASEKTGKIAREAKLKINISDTQSKIDEVYVEIGREIYEKYINHRDEEVALMFIEEFKKYIDNILTCGLLLYKSQYLTDFADCGCDTSDNQADMVKILQNLSRSLQYIIDKDVRGHKNFMSDSFNAWAKYLYENMEW